MEAHGPCRDGWMYPSNWKAIHGFWNMRGMYYSTIVLVFSLGMLEFLRQRTMNVLPDLPEK
ncbi:hypothetical protein KSP40_PGU005171 [Platanthera guangdongensis]|uniref:Uncharacterized protein n=1 Tax=Platanthera guangdongensis TaxID=2320717 RepID=A0ABR2MTD0_9ASPA